MIKWEYDKDTGKRRGYGNCESFDDLLFYLYCLGITNDFMHGNPGGKIPQLPEDCPPIKFKFDFPDRYKNK